MDKSWLEDYEAKEVEDHQRFLNSIKGRGIGPDDFYPGKERFIKLQDPVSMVYHEHLWAQLPFYGSSIIPLAAKPKEKEFLDFYGLNSTRDIDKLVDLAKNTGKVQFILASNPVYLGLTRLKSSHSMV